MNFSLPMRRWWLLLLLLLTACRPEAAVPQGAAPVENLVAARVSELPLADVAACTGYFVKHELDHTTQIHGEAVRLFESHGSGVAIGDLDQDGDLDLVLGNLGGPVAILWNEGALRFRKQTLEYQDIRSVATVDVDADGVLDLVFTQRFAPPLYFHNDGAGTFTRVNLPDVSEPAYAMSWADLDGDRDLDLVTASYNAELAKERPNDFLFNQRGGVMVYENLGDLRFAATRLTHDTHGLAVLLQDLNNDQRPDIWVGNDFDLQDQIWLNTGQGWEAKPFFRATSHSTMSLSAGDVDNDGLFDVFASDMKPYDISVETWVAWLPAMQTMRTSKPRSDPQLDENTLLRQSAAGAWGNTARQLGVDATGWSWSAQFGDLDNDGFLDLYVVNGMVDAGYFKHLPNNELVEQNQVFRNEAGQRFTLAPEWQLDSTASGRGMTMADLDNDGDLDIVVNNLLSPAQLFENQLCEGSALAVELQQADSPNPFAVGATVELRTSSGSCWRAVEVTSGHLSGNAPRLHFGFSRQATPQALRVHWPDGSISEVDKLTPNRLLQVARS